MLEIKSRPFTDKFPFLYMIELKDGTLSTTRKENAEKALEWLNTNGIEYFFKVTGSQKMKFCTFDFVQKR